MDLAQQIQAYLKDRGGIPEPLSISFLAAGEYNQNFLVKTPHKALVFRINHGSQLGLENQIEYEYRVLTALEKSGVTPRPLFCDPAPEGLPGGILLMEYLPGRPLDYDRDLDQAARIFARIHTLAPDPGLIVQADPVADIATESLGLIQRFPDHPRQEVGRLLLEYHGRVMELFEKTKKSFRSEPLVMVNTEVNSGNFLISDQGAFLVDWEKAVVSSRYQDLGHFMVVTTTRWKTEKTLSQEEKLSFLKTYQEETRHLLGTAPGLEELREGSAVLERTILLRALSWCYMAYYEYTSGNRAIQNKDTFSKIQEYLDNTPCFLN